MESKTEPSPAKRRRASRAGQARRFECKHPGCDKRYSRSEHLQRHTLNHAPRQIYRCEVANCGLTFVRADLYARHKARHDGPSSMPRERESTRSDLGTIQSQSNESTQSRPEANAVEASYREESSSEQPTLNGKIQSGQSSSTTLPQMPPSRDAGDAGISPIESSIPIDWTFNEDTSAQTNDNFAAWLFESPNSHDGGFNLDGGPFLDFGLDYSPKDMWDIGSLTAGFAAPATEQPEGSISEHRKAEISSMLKQFVSKQRNQNLSRPSDHLLFMRDESFPNLTIELLDKFISNYWAKISVQISIVHEPTFASNSCHLLLLLAIISLGAADLVKSQPKGYLLEYKELADLIMSHLRWEVFTDEDAEPPIQLWVAQTLLLLEFFEKQWSTRRMHERAHIHHASTLTLLRRGSPLVGRTEDETPPSGILGGGDEPANIGRVQNNSVDTWWMQWVRNESFNRVVFAAFYMDTLHALMYGHAADMAPYEIRTNLPCDDSLWAAKSADEVHRLDGNLKMYGVRSIPFLEGLKQSLHAQHVQTHSAARMLLMSGLLSVGWHVNRREKHLQFLETAPSLREQGRWRSLLLNAFEHWRSSFDEALGVRSNSVVGTASQDTDAATVLFHLAHMTMHADLIDCQIFSGSQRLLGRKVSKSDHSNVVQRMKAWSQSAFALHAVQHSTRLLYEALVKPGASRQEIRGSEALHETNVITYSCRNDPLLLRPWAIYLATLILWAYQHASASQFVTNASHSRYFEALDDQAMCCRYLTACASVDDTRQLSHVLSKEGGLPSVLNVVSKDLANGEPELFLEASVRLQTCRSMLADANPAWPPR